MADNQTSRRPRRIPAKTISPTLRKIFAKMFEAGIPVDEMARKLSRSENTLGSWRSGKSTPSIVDVEDFAGALGLELALVESEKEKQMERPTLKCAICKSPIEFLTVTTSFPEGGRTITAYCHGAADVVHIVDADVEAQTLADAEKLFLSAGSEPFEK